MALSRRDVRSGRLLERYCEDNYLLLGQFAHHRNIPYYQYFEQYGVCGNSMDWLSRHEPAFTALLSECGNLDHLVRLYAVDVLRGEPRFCPKYAHAYEQIQKRYPNFWWQVGHFVDQNGRTRHYVHFENYPCNSGGTLPTLYELLSRPEVLPPYVAPMLEKRSRFRSRRRRGLYCSWK